MNTWLLLKRPTPERGRARPAVRYGLAGLMLVRLGAGLASAETVIVTGADVGVSEQNAALTLADDLRERVPGEAVTVVAFESNTPWPECDQLFLVGTGASQALFASPELSNRGVDQAWLAPETFVVQVLPPTKPSERDLVVIRGGDVRGVHYGAAHFASHLLDIDPLAYWTGRKLEPLPTLNLQSYRHRAAPPVFGLRGYFDNDDDMLANFNGRKLVVEFDLWKELIDSLVRLGYNYIDLHDTLGRPEYYLRDYYTRMTDYHTDLALVEQVIDYAHLKGMLVQIPMYLGWEFKHITFDQVCLSEHFDRWMEVYDYYLNQSPLGKGDLFLSRPRHPIYDWAYRCPDEAAAGIAPGPLLTRMFNELEARVHARNPDARLVCDLWMEGLPMWRSGTFDPHRDVTMMWADHGFADFPDGWPDDFRGYAFGVYLHAGVWKNQVVQDPYPAAIGAALAEAARRGMTANLLVNGQNFKGFILNLEAAARAAWDPAGFDAEDFYAEWATRYFGAAAGDVVDALKTLHAAHAEVVGFRNVMKDSQQILRRAGQGRAAGVDEKPAVRALVLAEQALVLAETAASRLHPGSENSFEDQVRFPVRLFAQNLRFNLALTALNNAIAADPGNASSRSVLRRTAVQELTTLRELLRAGSGWSKWDGWYAPENFRIHTPPPTVADLAPLPGGEAP